ncbi:peptidoglycan-binding protein [Sutcliffiella horikoshii]|uniref:peptidoglycan-binding protein n=1 Tax=Sutcliffiella horikoshii TaxID=79883 RepID=UPI00384EAC54
MLVKSTKMLGGIVIASSFLYFVPVSDVYANNENEIKSVEETIEVKLETEEELPVLVEPVIDEDNQSETDGVSTEVELNNTDNSPDTTEEVLEKNTEVKTEEAVTEVEEIAEEEEVEKEDLENEESNEVEEKEAVIVEAKEEAIKEEVDIQEAENETAVTKDEKQAVVTSMQVATIKSLTTKSVQSTNVQLELGVRDQQVIRLKEKLNRLGFGGILLTDYFGDFTEKRLKEFQKFYGLNVTGIVDSSTNAKIESLLSGPFQLGKSHSDLIRIKHLLNSNGYGGITVTEYFGDYTEKKVKEFQQDHGLPVSGIIDSITMNKINSVLPYFYSIGDRHDDIVQLKKSLNNLGFGDIIISTLFGDFTEKKLKEFQRHYGLQASGRADEKTFQKIEEIMGSSLKVGDSSKDLIVIKRKLNENGFGGIIVSDYFGTYFEGRVKSFQKANNLPVSGLIDSKTRAKIDALPLEYFQVGDRDAKIVELKNKLNQLGFGDILITTLYGEFTEQKVREFQRYYNIPVTGKADVLTFGKIEEVLASPFQIGKSHSDLMTLKRLLNQNGYGQIIESDYFGSYTEQKVRDFQRDHNLAVNGLIDNVTLARLGEYELSTYQLGDRHNKLLEIKNKLNRLGFGNILVTTLFGDYTEEKVRDFQRYYSLSVNGNVNQETMKKLDSVLSSQLQLGKRNDEIINLKANLNNLGYGTILITDYFGDYTETKLKEFQKDNGLAVSGIADEVTLKKLDDLIKEARELITYQKYEISLSESISKQLSLNPPPQTDKYRNDSVFIHGSLLDIVNRVVIKDNGVNVRTEPKLASKYVYRSFNQGATFTYIDTVKGEEWGNSTEWYKIKQGDETLYVHSELANKNAQAAVVNSSANVRQKASTNSHVFGVVGAGTELGIVRKIESADDTWYELKYNETWRNATRTDFVHFLNPENNDMFQHLVLSSSAGVNSTQLNNILVNKGVLAGKGQAFIEAAQSYKVNEIYLMAHAFLETGNGSSKLGTGVEVGKDKNGNLKVVTSSNRDSLSNIKTTYNMYGINAVDSDPLNQGAIRAYEEGWFTPEAAIIGGAKFIGEVYIHNSYGQNTLYKMRWNPASPGDRQYATDMAWAVKQISTIKNLYDLLDNPFLHFDIPQYK